MTERTAYLLVADDLRIALTGKLDLHGIYTGDIVIPSEKLVANQLVFLWMLETDAKDPFQSLTFEITLPQAEPNRFSLSVLVPTPIPEGRTRWYMKQPQLIQPAILRPGRIKAKVIHEKGEIQLWGPWIVSVGSSVRVVG
jgi:hypothetical protein